MNNYGESQPMSELEMLRLKMNQRTDESLESTRRMVTMAEESHQMGAATMETLHHQGEQLNRMNDQMNVIHEDIKHTEKNLDNLEKCCGIFKLPWKRVSRPGNDKNFKQKDYSAVTVQPATGTYAKNSKRGEVPQSQPSGPFITRILDDDRETEMEQNLGHVSNIVGELKTMATDMNAEIQTHNAKLDDIANKTLDNQVRLQAAQTQATRIVGKPAKQNESIIPQPGLGTVAKTMAGQAMK
ncbi:unnamed protein product [Hymenolepis diminuta]|uniref:t-SNARE coiled-coil homology domain-containing protein n=1 Tax=Hymenolepis diminuta TaxID=6216 RepID=A0A564YTE3_HYMDI|nr:unnamed protein product [Hymenolepis diminuta]